MLHKVKEAIGKAKEIARIEEYTREFNDIVSRNEILVVHDTEGSIPASTLLNLFLTLKPSTSVTLLPLEIFYSVQAPYFSKPTIIFLTDIKNTPRASDTLRIMSIPHIVFTPKIPKNYPLHRQGFKIIELPENVDMEEAIFIEMYASSIMLLKTLDVSRKRIDKVQSEILTLDEVIEDLLEYYREECDEIVDVLRDGGEVSILYTELMKPIAQYLYGKVSIKGRCKRLLILPLDLVARYGLPAIANTIILRTSMEDDLFKAFRVRMGPLLRDRKIIDVNLKTDPLTVPYYAYIILWRILRDLGL